MRIWALGMQTKLGSLAPHLSAGRRSEALDSRPVTITRASTPAQDRISMFVRSFSTTSRPALRAAAYGGRPRAGNDTTVTQRPASPNAAGCRSARGPRHFRQVADEGRRFTEPWYRHWS